MHTAAKWLIASTVVLISLGSGISQAEPTPEGAPAITKKIAIVIDDFGNDMRGTEEMMALTIPFTAAVMPFYRRQGVMPSGHTSLVTMYWFICRWNRYVAKKLARAWSHYNRSVR